MVNTGTKTIYIWRSRVFEEFFYMYVPRFVFLTMSCYVIYRITMKQRQNQRMTTMIRSHRQEQIDSQLEHIETVLNASRNEFEPGKNIQYDRSYEGNHLKYAYQKEE